MSKPDFRDQLRPFLDVTVDELEKAMRQVPAEVVARLAEGAHPGRYACNVCRAFTKDWYTNEGTWDRTNPMHIVFCYHEVPKIDMKVAEDQWSGPAARDVYSRCMEIYRIAREVADDALRAA